jgi:hypothetical protein
MAVEDTTGAADFQDAVFIIRNVRLIPTSGGGTLPAGPFGIRGLRLLDADTDTAISAIGNGTVLDLSDGPFSVEAVVSGTVGSVRFKIDGLSFNTENFGPYTLAGESGADINPWMPSVGTHTLEARTYSGPNGTGSTGGFKRVTFTVVA